MVVNARVDVFRHSSEVSREAFEEGIRRGKKVYAGAGADCIYPIGLVDQRLIAEFVEAVVAPIPNVMLLPDRLTLAQLAPLGAPGSPWLPD